MAGASIRAPMRFRCFLCQVSPNALISPLLGRRRPVNIFNVVVFPAPLGPKRPYMDPDGIWSEILFTAKVLP